ncbi:MAG: 2Fe-2S iron-sulfur cluster-binding protein, partial [Pyrinomonadaceae bacterium]
MITFVLNDQTVETDLPGGMTVLDFVRYRRNLKGTKIGCREGDCGACTVLVGELDGDRIRYRTQTSCLMPLVNARHKHIVTVEGINRADGELTEVQRALVEESGTQCGFCTVGFVMSLTGFCLDETPKTPEMAVSSVDGNICRCTGYKSIERACGAVVGGRWPVAGQENLEVAIERGIVPHYFAGMKDRLTALLSKTPKSEIRNPKSYVGGGTDLYVQRPEEMVGAGAENLFDQKDLRKIVEKNDFVEVGASAVVSDLMVSPVFRGLFP